MKHRLERLEMHITHACNLACESCSHYSDHGHKGVTSLQEAEEWMRLWSGRLSPRSFALLGGEPSIHPDLPAFAELARRYWPDATIRLATNGFFLHRHPELPSVLSRIGNSVIALSVHHFSEEYREQVYPVVSLLEKWKAEYGISVTVAQSYKNWTRRYLGFGGEIRPFRDGDARRSWEACPARSCKQLYQGKLWKCAPLAYLHLQAEKFILSPEWDRYLGYQPLGSDCSDEVLSDFLRLEDESFCEMCPASPETFVLPDPRRQSVKQFPQA